MVFSEATLAMPILAGYAYHKGNWKKRAARKWNALLNDEKAPVPSATR
jgi:deoxyhypusine synthase